VELATLGITPEWTLEWRHRAVERMLQLALEAGRNGRHFLLCGDPVPPGEVIAAPSGHLVGRVEVCLLDVSPDAQRARLLARGDAPELLPDHVAFADWMRHHVHNPTYRPDVIVERGWEAMQWHRWLDSGAEPLWTPHVVDTTELAPGAVAQRVLDWVTRTLDTARQAP
jgi:hypothetical protein